MDTFMILVQIALNASEHCMLPQIIMHVFPLILATREQQESTTNARIVNDISLKDHMLMWLILNVSQKLLAKKVQLGYQITNVRLARLFLLEPLLQASIMMNVSRKLIVEMAM